jgi:hypothetical protein
MDIFLLKIFSFYSETNSKCLITFFEYLNMKYIYHIDLLTITNNNDNYPEFREVINEYFAHHKDDIINTMNLWHGKLPSNKKAQFSQSLGKLINLLK